MKTFFIRIIVIMGLFIMSCNSPFEREQGHTSTQMSRESIFRPGFDYFLGVWTQVADENGKPIKAPKTPIKMRITKPDGFFYFVEVSFNNEVEYSSMPGDGIYESHGFLLRNRKLINSTLEFKHDINDPNGDYLYEEGGAGFFKQLN